MIQHRLGFTSWYAHLASIASWAGEQVVGGTRIGYVGSTGPHLHFKVRRYDTPIDPAPLLLPTAATQPLRSGGAGAKARRYRECARISRGAVHDAPRNADWIARERLCP